MTHIAVLDIGKTNIKVALVDRRSLTEVAVRTSPNRVLPGPPYPHFDTAAQWDFFCTALSELAAGHEVEAISITTHGACAALLDAQGDLAAPVMDYEFSGPDTCRAEYDTLRPPFAQTGSPALPFGLNLGAQIFWQLQQDPGLRDRLHRVVMWPQYWGHLLTGVFASDLCSLGTHTDLWCPAERRFSDLVGRLGLSEKMAPPRPPGDVLGVLLPRMQQKLGLGPVPVLCGIHDSNASLLPHLLGRTAPFSVISTGTWVISMAVGGQTVPLNPALDTLLNVNAFGWPVPSARFMGGREYDTVQAGLPPCATEEDAARVLAGGVMLMPAVVPDSGPFQGRRHHWLGPEADAAAREVALGYYLALMTAESLQAIGADGPSVIEGPFAANRWFCAMLQAATGRAVLASAMRTGTAVGAAMLWAAPTPVTDSPPPTVADPRLVAYAEAWRRAARGAGPGA